ncbi:MAG: hypothetical protein V4532_07500 [Pseudomonadota bacterium]
MLKLINDYLQLGVPSSDDGMLWPLAIATVLAATMILNRQPRD